MIGKDVRTGVDTSFVAPVTVGDGAYTGAGSVITEDVPPGALGIARPAQTNVEGYAERASGSGGRAGAEDSDKPKDESEAVSDGARSSCSSGR